MFDGMISFFVVYDTSRSALKAAFAVRIIVGATSIDVIALW